MSNERKLESQPETQNYNILNLVYKFVETDWPKKKLSIDKLSFLYD